MADDDGADDEHKRMLLPLDDVSLRFLRDEGLTILALFRRIRDPAKRELVVDLVKAILDAQPETDGGSS